MAEERTIPTIQAAAEFNIFVNEAQVPRSVVKLSVNVMKMANKISSAIVVLQDGNPSEESFDLSNGDLFIPGNKLSIEAGDVDNPVEIFTGIIIKQSLKVRSNRASQLIVECRHKAIKTTIGRKNTSFQEMTDTDVFEKILKDNGFGSTEIDIPAPSTLSHKELIQYNCTDWDFMLTRAELAGKIVLTNDDKITIKSPSISGEAALSIMYGNTIIELDAEMDSRNQYAAVKAKSWDMAKQEVAESEASEPGELEEQGNLTASDLAGVMELEEFTLTHPGSVTTEELKSWADAQLLKSRLSKIRGRAKFDGIATINPGDVIELHGLGERFSGKAFVSGVRQDYDGINGWKTQAQFGHSPEWFTEEHQFTVQKAGGLLPGVVGLHTGIVTDNEDPEGEMRVRVKFPHINESDDGVWARLALPDAGNERGLFFRPEIGDEVVTGFLYDDPRFPVILGMLNSSKLKTPISPSNDNHQKGYFSREKMKLVFDDEKKSIQIETPGGNKITISDDTKGITLEDQNSNKVEMNENGITLTAAKKLELKAGTELVIGGPQVKLNADSAVEIKGATAKVNASGPLELKGAIVNIN